MTKRNMPLAHFGVRPSGVRAEIASPKVFDRWRPELRARASAEDATDTVVIDIMDVIGDDWYEESTSAKSVARQLKAAKDRPVVVNINSPGGTVFDGLSIYNLLRAHSGEVTTRVVGIAASAASIVAMAGDRVEVAQASFLMIHNAWCMTFGNRHDLGATADHLGSLDAVMADIYAARTGIGVAEIAQMMDRESYISGRSAIDQGFSDGLLPADQIEARADLSERAPQIRALGRADAAMARGGLPRSERRGIIKEITGTPRAAEDGMPSAADQLAGFLANIKSTKT